MLEVIDPDVPASKPKPIRQLTWQAVGLITVMLAFFSFVLWMTASHFDTSELKTILGAAAGITAREIWPVIKQVIANQADTLRQIE